MHYRGTNGAKLTLAVSLQEIITHKISRSTLGLEPYNPHETGIPYMTFPSVDETGYFKIPSAANTPDISQFSVIVRQQIPHNLQ
jgi:hypothetical protein